MNMHLAVCHFQTLARKPSNCWLVLLIIKSERCIKYLLSFLLVRQEKFQLGFAFGCIMQIAVCVDETLGHRYSLAKLIGHKTVIQTLSMPEQA
jgi:hypothetical protein